MSLLYNTPKLALVLTYLWFFTKQSYETFQSNHMRLFGISLISSTHSTLQLMLGLLAVRQKRLPIMLFYRDESTLLPNKSIVSLTFGLIGVLTELADSKPNFFTRFPAYLDWGRNIPNSCQWICNPRKWFNSPIMLISNLTYISLEKL